MPLFNHPRIGGPLISSTAGSVLFVGTNGIFQQDNSNLFWDDSNNRLGIGTASPGAPLSIVNTVDSAPIAQWVGDGANCNPRFERYQANAAPVSFIGVKGRGSFASKGQTLSGDQLVAFVARGVDNAGTPAMTGNLAEVRFIAGQNFTTAAQGCYFEFYTVPSGSTTQTLRGTVSMGGDLLWGTGTEPGGTRGKTLTMGDNNGNPTPGTDTASWFVKLVAGVAECFTTDEGGTTTQQSPHAMDSPGGQDSDLPLPIIIKHENCYTGHREWLHLSALAKAVEALTGQQFVFTEELSPAEIRDWDADQRMFEAERKEKLVRWARQKKDFDDGIGDNPGPPPQQAPRKPIPGWLRTRLSPGGRP